MKDLQQATERICDLKGSLVAVDVVLSAVVAVLPAAARADLARVLPRHAETARSALLHVPISEHSIQAFERDVRRSEAMLAAVEAAQRTATAAAPERLLMAAVRVLTFAGDRALTSASGFFFERDRRLFLVTSRHVLYDAATAHHPDRIEVGVHTDAVDLRRRATLSIALYRDGTAVWRQARDGGGDVDVAVLEIDRATLPEPCAMHAFGVADLPPGDSRFEVGDGLAIAGFPLGFHDTVHHLPVVRRASIASAYGIRFQGQGFFLTDGRTHRGSSGAPVLRRRGGGGWALLGVHSSRMDMATRDTAQDESLGLNCAWYADILIALTEASTGCR